MIVYFEHFLENYRSRQKLWATPLEGTRNELILTKNVLGHNFGNFFTSTSGHPAHNQNIWSYAAGSLRFDGGIENSRE
jgi:hypothetical protein